MRLLHTADWHLGQTFFEYDRKVEHVRFLDWLRQQIKELRIDVLLIAGDIFDSPNPSAESQRLFYAFLREITVENSGLQVIVIAGNHDSAARLEAPDPLLQEMRVTVRGIVRRDAEGQIAYEHLIVPLYEGDQLAAYCLAVPYLRQGDYPESESYALGVQAMYEQLFRRIASSDMPVIAMGHLQATGSEISEHDRSERTIIGGLESVSPASFAPAIRYTALGHLHRSQRVSGRENVRYSGAPIPMSFAEKNNKHGVVFVEIKNRDTSINVLEFKPPVHLLSVLAEASSMMEVLAEIDRLPEGEITHESPYLEIKVLVTEPEPSLRFQLEEALRGKAVRLARIVAVTPQHEKRDTRFVTYEELQVVNPMDIATDVFVRKYGGDSMPENMKELLESVIKEVGV